MNSRADRYAEREWRATSHKAPPAINWPKPKARPSLLARILGAFA